MLKENAIPPQPGMPFKTNHKFPALAKLNIHIADTLMEFKAYVKGDGKRKILLNNFDAAVRPFPLREIEREQSF